MPTQFCPYCYEPILCDSTPLRYACNRPVDLTDHSNDDRIHHYCRVEDVPQMSVEIWEADEAVLCTYLGSIGGTLPVNKACIISRWFNENRRLLRKWFSQESLKNK